MVTGVTERTAVPSRVVYTPGMAVEVRRRFDQAWARGFEISEQTDSGYRLRRHSDGTVLPVAFPAADLRPAEFNTPTG